MAKVVDTLYIALGIDASKLDQGLATAQSKLAVGLKGMMSKVFAPLLAGASLSFGVLFDSITKELGQMNSLSKAYKVNIEDMTAWSRAIENAGGSVEGFEQTLGTLNMNLTRMAITGHSRVKPFFEAMGLDATELAQKPITKALEEITKAIEGMDKRTSANLLRGMGFDAASIKLLQSGTKGLKELLDKQKELGVYTLKDAEALTKMKKGFREIISLLKTAFVPIFTLIISVASRMTQYLVSAVLLIRRNMDALKVVALGLAIVFRGQLIKALMDFGRVLMTNPVVALVTAIAGLLLLLDDLIVYSKGGKSALAGFWRMFGTPEQVKKGLDDIAKKFEGFLKMLGSFSGGKFAPFVILATIIGVTIAAIVSLISFIGAIPLAVGAMVAFVIAYWDELTAAVKAIGNIFMGIFGIGGVLNQAFDAIPGMVQAVTDALMNAFGSAADWVLSKWQGVVNFFQNAWNFVKNIGNSVSNISPKLALAGGGGSVSNTSTVDNSTHNTTIHTHTAEATNAAMDRAGLTAQSGTGVK